MMKVQKSTYTRLCLIRDACKDKPGLSKKDICALNGGTAINMAAVNALASNGAIIVAPAPKVEVTGPKGNTSKVKLYILSDAGKAAIANHEEAAKIKAKVKSV